MRINGAWGMALREKLRRAFGTVAEASHVDDGILLSFAPGQVPPGPERLVRLVAPEEVDTLLGTALIGSPLFATRFRHAAVRALYIPRMFRGARTPAYLQRLKADALLEAVGGRAEFPVVAETLRECFTDAFDVPRLRRLLERIHDGELWTRHVDTPLPSPFVYPLLLAWDWAYLGAGHAEERRSDAVVMRKAWSVSAGPLRPEIVATVEAELQKTTPERRARDANELAAILDDLGDLTAAEVAERALGDADELVASLHGERRVVQVELASGRRAWIAASDAPLYAAVATPEGLERVALRLTRTRGPVTPGWLAALELLQGEDFPVRLWEQDLLPARVDDYEREWLDRLGLSGEIAWTPFERREGRVGVALRENAGWLREGAAPPAEIDARTKNVFLHLQLRGASFAQDLTRSTGLTAPEVLAALWRLFWVGLVTPDTFSAIVAGTATPKRPDGAPPRRRRRGLAHGARRQLPVIGRWSALSDEERLSPEELEEARARLLLSRYGVVARELAQGDWSTLRHTLLRMEYGGEIVRGYFVEGLPGEQYALADALGELDAPARRAEPHALVNMVDPANLWGRVFALVRRDGSRATAPRLSQNWLVFRQGRPVVLAEGQGRELTPLAGWEDVDFPGAIGALRALMERPLALRPLRRFAVSTWDGRPVRETEAFPALARAGFTVDGGRLSWDGHPGPRAWQRSC